MEIHGSKDTVRVKTYGSGDKKFWRIRGWNWGKITPNWSNVKCFINALRTPLGVLRMSVFFPSGRWVDWVFETWEVLNGKLEKKTFNLFHTGRIHNVSFLNPKHVIDIQQHWHDLSCWKLLALLCQGSPFCLMFVWGVSRGYGTFRPCSWSFLLGEWIRCAKGKEGTPGVKNCRCVLLLTAPRRSLSEISCSALMWKVCLLFVFCLGGYLSVASNLFFFPTKIFAVLVSAKVLRECEWWMTGGFDRFDKLRFPFDSESVWFWRRVCIVDDANILRLRVFFQKIIFTVLVYTSTWYHTWQQWTQTNWYRQS